MLLTSANTIVLLNSVRSISTDVVVDEGSVSSASCTSGRVNWAEEDWDDDVSSVRTGRETASEAVVSVGGCLQAVHSSKM